MATEAELEAKKAAEVTSEMVRTYNYIVYLEKVAELVCGKLILVFQL